MNEAHKVLVRIAEAHATAYTALEEAGRAREVKGNHALILVPDVDHAVELIVTRAYLIYIKQRIPVLAELSESLIYLRGGVEFGNQGVSLLLVDDLQRLPLVVLLIFDVTQQEYEVFRLARFECYFDVVRGDRTPSVGMRVAGLTLHDSLRVGKLVVKTYERLAVGIEALNLRIDMIESVVVATLAILRLVINGRTFNFYFTRREVTLEILHIRCGIPQTPLLEREEFEVLHFVRIILQRQLLHLAPFFQRHEEEHRGLDAVLATRDAGVAHAVTALVEIERCLTGLPSWIPYRIAIFDVKVSASIIHRHIVVAIARDAAELRILVEAVAASGVGDE